MIIRYCDKSLIVTFLFSNCNSVSKSTEKARILCHFCLSPTVSQYPIVTACFEYSYFSASFLKVNHFKEFIPKAFPDGSDLILDAEVLMVDNRTGDPLPFGTLGKHKASLL